MGINLRSIRRTKKSRGEQLVVNTASAESQVKIELLKSRQDIIRATANLKRILVEGHHDSQKNWDLDLTVQKCLTYPRDINVLDAGSGSKSVFARTALSLGYENVYACDLQKSNVKGVESSIQDIANTDYQSEYFQFISCLSVIEHGVNLEAFFREMYRISSNNSTLCVTTDFWPTYENHSKKYPYGPDKPSMKLFNNESITELLELASDSGWCAPTYTPFEEFHPRPIRWERMNAEYTFIFISFFKTEGSIT